MSVVDNALETQLRNLQTRAGKSLDELFGILRASGLAKHGELRDLLKRELGMGHGDANTLVHVYRQREETGKPAPASAASSAARSAVTPSAGAAPDTEAVLDGIYAGKKEALRPIHDAVMKEVRKFGDFEIAPKKNYLSLRRKKQFAMVGPPTNSRVEVGLNMKGVDATDRLLANPPGGMCQYTVRLTDPSEVDAELLGWIRQAFDAAG